MRFMVINFVFCCFPPAKKKRDFIHSSFHLRFANMHEMSYHTEIPLPVGSHPTPLKQTIHYVLLPVAAAGDSVPCRPPAILAGRYCRRSLLAGVGRAGRTPCGLPWAWRRISPCAAPTGPSAAARTGSAPRDLLPSAVTPTDRERPLSLWCHIRSALLQWRGKDWYSPDPD